MIGTVGTRGKVDVARSYGYGTVVVRDEWIADPSATPRPDLIVDLIGGATRAASLERLGIDGRLVVIGNASDADDPGFDATNLFLTSRTVAGYGLGALSTAYPDLAGGALREAIGMVIDQQVRVDVNTVLPIDRVVGAHCRIESGTTTGKTVLRVGT